MLESQLRVCHPCRERGVLLNACQPFLLRDAREGKNNYCTLDAGFFSYRPPCEVRFCLANHPLTLSRFKTFGYITMAQALNFVSDLKFGHYMKIPPRTMFMSQVVATTFSCFIQIAVLNSALGGIDGVCELTQPEHFSCPGGRVFFSGKLFCSFFFHFLRWFLTRAAA